MNESMNYHNILIVHNSGVFNSKDISNNQTTHHLLKTGEFKSSTWRMISNRCRSGTCSKSYAKYNWTRTALHHHMLNES